MSNVQSAFSAFSQSIWAHRVSPFPLNPASILSIKGVALSSNLHHLAGVPFALSNSGHIASLSFSFILFLDPLSFSHYLSLLFLTTRQPTANCKLLAFNAEWLNASMHSCSFLPSISFSLSLTLSSKKLLSPFFLLANFYSHLIRRNLYTHPLFVRKLTIQFKLSHIIIIISYPYPQI